ncbi:MAG: hypothetical protein JKY19_11880 [Alcanivoracaceae bacterium]|nr:hypothetical protein [Alcanivoracaceae bacterium]
MNKHVKIALIMAPFLALISYGITGYFQTTTENKEGDYQLRLSGDCRPNDNSCVMQAGEFELMLISSIKKGKRQLGIVANQPVSYLSMALAGDDNEFVQFRMMKSDDEKYWQVSLNDDQKLDGFLKIRLAAHSKESNYFIENNIRL